MIYLLFALGTLIDRLLRRLTASKKKNVNDY